MKMPSVMGNHFSRVPRVDIPRSQFDMSHGYKTTFNAGKLIPVLVQEILPGDTVKIQMDGFARLSTPLKPIMDNLYLDSFFFFVPYRLVWDNFEKFMGAQDSPGASTDYLIPQVASHGVTLGSLSDYFGLPVRTATLSQDVEPVSALPYRSVNLIWNEWFRDQNLQAKIVVPTDDGPDPIAIYNLLPRGKRGDYFTTCLPWPQKGTAVRLPLANSSATANWGNIVGDGNPPTFRNVGGGVTGKTLRATTAAAASPAELGGGSGTWTVGSNVYWDSPHLLINNTEMGTINQLRQAVQIQRLLEREARGGTRYIEWTKEIFGVTNPDFRLQRPEYLGGGSTPVVVSPVAQTGPTVTGQSPQGNLAAVGTASWQGHGCAKSLTEHGTLIAFVCVRADLTYQQNILRQWSRRTKLDLAMPVTANLGEQAVLRKELYSIGDASDQDVFGYQERFAEYRFRPSLVTGQFRSQVATPLDMWHLAQKFDPVAPPTLGSTFIQENPPIARIVAVPSEPQFLLDVYFRSTFARCLPAYGVPGLMDHF